MKNITKNLISVLALVMILSLVGVNVPLVYASRASSVGSSTSSYSGGSSTNVNDNDREPTRFPAPPVPPEISPNPPVEMMAISTPIIVSAYADVTQTTATLHGVVNPNGLSTTAAFFTLTGGPYGTVNIGNGTSNVTLPPYTLTGLTPGTNYQFKVFASNINGVTDGSWISFTTLSSPSGLPTVESETVTNVTQTTATLNGIVNPHGVKTLASYFTLTSGPYGTVDIGNGTSNVTLPPYTLTGLTPGTTYKFKVFVANAQGLFLDGAWVSFTTLTQGGSCTIPTISSISPNHVTEGAGATTVTVTGSNFVNGTTIARADGSARTTNVSSSTSLAMILTASDVDSHGTISITVTNGSGCDSNAVIFTVNNSGGGGGGGGGGGSSLSPSVTTQNAGGISDNSATLNGTVDPNGYETTAWFEFGTSTSLGNETAHVSEGSGNSALALAQNISGLSPNTTYYFRVIAKNSHGTVKGNILSFSTTRVPNGIIATVQATNKNSTSAKLNGLFINKAGANAIGYFEYGTSASLGEKTVEKSLGSSTVSFSKIVTGLTPKTIYFFRAVAISQNVTYNGKILVFQTSDVGTIITPTENEAETETTVVETESSSMLKITNDVDEIAAGDEINYLVTFSNTESKNLENVKLSVQLPNGMDFIESNFGKFNSDTETVDFDLGILIPKQVGSMTVKAKANSKVQDSDILITTAVMSYNLADSIENKDEIAYTTNHVIAGTGLEANPLFGANLLPNSLLGWLALILVILALIIIGRKLYINYLAKNSRSANANQIDNLPM